MGLHANRPSHDLHEVKKTLLPSSENDTTDTETFLRKNILLRTTKVTGAKCAVEEF